MFHQMIGDVSDREGPKLKIPEPITVTTIHERKVQFLMSSKTCKESLEKRLSAVYSNITFPSDYKGNIKLECLLTNTVKDCRKLAKSWKKVALENLNDFLNNLSVENIGVLQDAWKDMMETLKNKTIQNPDDVAVAVEKLTCEIWLMGQSQLVSQMTKELKRDLKQIEDDLEKKKKQVTENVTLKRHQILLLNEEHFIEMMQDKYKGMKVICDVKNCRMIFEGLSTEVINAKVDMYEVISSLATSDAGNFSEGKCKLLQDSKVKNYILQLMKDENISAVWETGKQNLKTYAKSDDSAVKAVHILQKAIIESPISVPLESQYILASEMWDDKVEEIRQTNIRHTISIELDQLNGTIIVCATNADNGAVLEIIQTFLADNTILESKLDLNTGMIRFLQQSDRGAKMNEISKPLVSDQVKIEVSNIGIVIKGTAVGSTKAKHQINALIQKVEKKKHILNKPGILKLMQSEDGDDKIRHVEDTENVIIVLDDGDADRVGQNSSLQRGDVVQEIARCNQGRYTVLAMLGDITELQTDVLVNAANASLKHDGGLAKAIVVKGNVCAGCIFFIRT